MADCTGFVATAFHPYGIADGNLRIGSLVLVVELVGANGKQFATCKELLESLTEAVQYSVLSGLTYVTFGVAAVYPLSDTVFMEELYPLNVNAPQNTSCFAPEDLSVATTNKKT